MVSSRGNSSHVSTCSSRRAKALCSQKDGLVQFPDQHRPDHIPTAFDFLAMKLNMSSAVGSLLAMLYFNLCVADLIEYSGHCGEGVTGLDWHQPLSQKGPSHVFELFCLVEGIYLAILMRCCSVSLIGLINHLDNLSKQYL
ncbi:hypothetical protein OUZ56_022936 [Daphnia magna]|uniref:Uncharacterized protein n=1 Tax=Daphnia magna TaxID=35525 RepID=A0ABR0AXW9_9CRUS|nr:hypothetical protein OUZ56_022936 [Daphnia magna]